MDVFFFDALPWLLAILFVLWLLNQLKSNRVRQARPTKPPTKLAQPLPQKGAQAKSTPSQKVPNRPIRKAYNRVEKTAKKSPRLQSVPPIQPARPRRSVLESQLNEAEEKRRILDAAIARNREEEYAPFLTHCFFRGARVDRLWVGAFLSSSGSPGRARL